MRERIEQIGGSLEIVSNPGNGTTITAHLTLGRIRLRSKQLNQPPIDRFWNLRKSAGPLSKGRRFALSSRDMVHNQDF